MKYRKKERDSKEDRLGERWLQGAGRENDREWGGWGRGTGAGNSTEGQRQKKRMGSRTERCSMKKNRDREKDREAERQKEQQGPGRLRDKERDRGLDIRIQRRTGVQVSGKNDREGKREGPGARQRDREPGRRMDRQKENDGGMKESATDMRRQGKADTGRDLGGVGDAEGGREVLGRGRREMHAQGPRTHRSSRSWRHMEKCTIQMLLSHSLSPFLFCSSGYSTVIHLREHS